MCTKWLGDGRGKRKRIEWDYCAEFERGKKSESGVPSDMSVGKTLEMDQPPKGRGDRRYIVTIHDRWDLRCRVSARLKACEYLYHASTGNGMLWDEG